MKMNFLNRFAGVLALIALAIGVFGLYLPVSQDIQAALGAFDIPTRFPNGHLDTNGGYYVDGTAIIDGSGAISATTGTFSSTLAVTATTTLSDGLNLNNPGLCINIYATSTATRGHFTASSSSLVNGVSTGVMLFDYGACSY